MKLSKNTRSLPSKNILEKPGQMTKAYADRTPEDYINGIDPEIRSSLNEEQLAEIRRAIDSAIPKPAPKIVDLRFVVDLVLTRFYVVLLVGKDRRKKPRKYVPNQMAKVGNTLAAIVLLVGLNLTISAFLFFGAYLVKSAFGIDLFPGNLRHQVQKIDQK
ncbi:MAG: hypothetical protein SWY16_04380 [Cyanobacteriota bacterium]|nr:hypothetical protein [Cyanobacteriota bacterium]